MPFPFALVCDLLEECQKLHLTHKPNRKAVINWFSRYRGRIDAHDTDISALLSTLLPEKRTDRVFCIQAARLEKIVGRALMLGSSRVAEITRYKQPGLGIDLADCVERVLSTTPNPPSTSPQITIEDIDQTLHSLASKVRWSSPAIRSQATPTQSGQDDLGSMFRCLGAKEAKWFTRLILKDFQPLILDSNLVYSCCHPLLPLILKIHDDFTTAIQVVREVKGTLLPSTVRGPRVNRRSLSSLKPRLGVKVGRQNWVKARSIKHCVGLSPGRVTVEKKIDGEYCQIHVDATKRTNRIQIFSKSGKDSTEDRKGLHEAIEDSLRLGSTGSKIHQKCILEGELVVYSAKENKILPFHKIRNHVARRGRFMNVDDDTPPMPYEKLMIIYYDILLLDNQSLLDVRHTERYKLLCQVVSPITGHAELVSGHPIDFGHSFAVSEMRKVFANVIIEKGEGLVVKPDEPYFDFHDNEKPFGGRCIKLKKEYIGKFGDVGDFAVVGAGFDPSKAKTYNLLGLRWTHFYVGCLNNKEQVKRWGEIPEFTVVSVVELNETQLTTLLKFCNPSPVPLDENTATKLRMPKGVETRPPLTAAFSNPLVFDLRCFSFDKPGNVGFWTLRFPVVSKIHFDRDYSETVDFEDFQEMARKSVTAPETEDSQENLAWIARLESADPRGFAVDAVSQMTTTTVQTPSPIRSTQSTTGRDTVSPAIIGRNLQACIGSDRTQLYNRVETLFATPKPSFMAPPPLLPQQKSSSQIRTRNSPPKRPVETHCGKLLLKSKRRKSSLSETTVVAPLQGSNRAPLAGIDGNAMASSSTPHGSSSRKSASQKHDREAGSIHSSDSLKHPSTQASGAQGEDILLQEPAEVMARTYAKGQSASSTGVRVTTRTFGVENAEPRISGEAPSGVGSECIYASSSCQLSDRTVLLSSTSLLNLKDLTPLLEAHGVSSIGTTIEDWFDRCKSDCQHKKSIATHQRNMLLIDTTKDSAETKDFLADIKRTKKKLSCRKDDLMSVYDWRVLKHLAILEDKNITTKYYDGFHDPWRRWYCGTL